MRIGPQSECQVAVAAVVVAGLIRVVSLEFNGQAKMEERSGVSHIFIFLPLAFSLGTRRGES